MSPPSAGDFGVPQTDMCTLTCGADADVKRSAKAGLHALFLLLHFFLKKHHCKYFSVLQKKKKMFVQFYWEGKFCYIFKEKKTDQTGALQT